MKSRLNIDGVDVGFMSELPVSTNYQISDVRSPDKRNSAFSKTILVPGSNEAKILFENIFEVNSSLSNFNPNIKVPAKYYVNELLVLDGFLQLLRINNKYINDLESTIFECSIVGDSGNLFSDIAGLYLTDIDVSDLDHSLVYASGLFNPTLGEGYCYAYQDYGIESNGAPRTNDWRFEQLKPLTFEKELVMRIVEDAGYSIADGGYFDTDYAKRIVIPDNNAGGLKMTDAQRADNECYIGKSGTQTSITYNGSFFSPPLAGTPFWIFVPVNQSILNPVRFDDEAAPYFDANGRWDPVTNFRFTVNDAGYYYFAAALNVTVELVTAPVGSASWLAPAYDLIVEFQKSTNGGSTWTNAGNITTQVAWNDLVANTIQTFSISGQLPIIYLNSGDLIRVALVQGPAGDSFAGVRFLDGGGSDVTTGTAQMRFNILTGSELDARMAVLDLIYGQTVDYSQCIPAGVTQLDFLTSIIKLENLYFEPSKYVKNQYVVETREDFFYFTGADAVDWTDKWDISLGEEIIPMGELDWNKIVFRYQSDSDHYNKLYEDTYKEVYGTETIETENEFIKNTLDISVVFAATPGVGNPVNDIVVPAYYTLDTTTNIVTPMKTKIRRLYFGGMKSCNSHVLFIGNSSSIPSQYPYVGHVDDPKNPTIDLCFDNPLEVYWTFPGNTYTDNDRYGERYSKQIEEITDQNSKIVVRWFKLDETDINKLSFRKLAFVRDAYFIVNKILDFDPQVEKSVKVELLKLKAGTVFVPNNDIGLDDLGGDTGSSTERTANVNIGTGILLGTGNYNNGIGIVVVGDNNVIG